MAKIHFRDKKLIWCIMCKLLIDSKSCPEKLSFYPLCLDKIIIVYTVTYCSTSTCDQGEEPRF